MYYQPTTYNQCQKYCHDISTQQVPSIDLHDREKVDKRSSIHSGITTPYIKQVPVITFGTEQEYRKTPPLSSGSYLITENSKVNKLKLHTKLPSKDK